MITPGMSRSAKKVRIVAMVSSVEPVSQMTKQSICAAAATKHFSMIADSFLTIMFKHSRFATGAPSPDAYPAEALHLSPRTTNDTWASSTEQQTLSTEQQTL